MRCFFLAYMEFQAPHRGCAVVSVSVWSSRAEDGLATLGFFSRLVAEESDYRRRKWEKMTACRASRPGILNSPFKWWYGGLWEWRHVIKSGEVRRVCRGDWRRKTEMESAPSGKILLNSPFVRELKAFLSAFIRNKVTESSRFFVFVYNGGD